MPFTDIKDGNSVNSTELFASHYKRITRLRQFGLKTSDFGESMGHLRLAASLETDETALKRVILPGGRWVLEIKKRNMGSEYMFANVLA